MHVNGKNVHHYLTNDDVDGDQQAKSQGEAVVPLEVFDCFFGEEDSLLVNDEAIHEDHAGTEERVGLKEETVLIIAQYVVTHLSKKQISKTNHQHSLPHSPLNKILNSIRNNFHIWVG